jgi:PIN domain nuclease of toxin-antitoxin system
LGSSSCAFPYEELLHEQEQQNQIRLFPIRVEHILNLKTLPLIHSDPFDRLLIAQANYEDIATLTVDPQVAKYPVKAIW